MFKLVLGGMLRVPILMLALQNIPDSETRLTSALVLFVIGDMLMAHSYETRGAARNAIPPSGPPKQNDKCCGKCGDDDEKV